MATLFGIDEVSRTFGDFVSEGALEQTRQDERDRRRQHDAA
jgi:hypothetical protein